MLILIFQIRYYCAIACGEPNGHADSDAYASWNRSDRDSEHRVQIRRRIMRISLALTSVIVAMVVMLVPSASYAWNIICIISYSASTKANEDIGPVKWEADAHALQGISLFYAGVSELQRIAIEDDESLTVPQSFGDSGTTSLDAATSLLSRSAEEIELALRLADENGLGDQKGLSLLHDIHEGLMVSVAAMSSDNVLPSLHSLQHIANLIGEATHHGISLSLHHLEAGTKGHSEGGISFK